jgi:MYXO-CTERM domain-containing protein
MGSTAVPDGTACTDNKCMKNQTCTAGVCGGGSTAVTCTAQDECHDVGSCDKGTGACSNPQKADGTPCSGGTCQGGACGAAGVDAGGGTDAGGGPTDGGSVRDGSTKKDSGQGTDSGDQDADTGSTGDNGGSSGGCGCRTVEAKSGNTAWLAIALGAVAIVAARRRRRTR